MKNGRKGKEKETVSNYNVAQHLQVILFVFNNIASFCSGSDSTNLMHMKLGIVFGGISIHCLQLQQIKRD